MTGWLLVGVGALLLVPGSARSRVIAPRWHPPRPGWRRRPTSEAALVEVLGGLRDELRAGAGLRDGFERAARGCRDPAVVQALATCRLGGDVPASLRSACGGRPVLLALAALWRVCEGSGATMADALDRLVDSAERNAAARREVQAQLAGPRATVRVLAVLPAVGIGMGLLMGADPLGFLLGSVWGWGCLLLAGALEVVGVVWMRRLVSGVEASM